MPSIGREKRRGCLIRGAFVRVRTLATKSVNARHREIDRRACFVYRHLPQRLASIPRSRPGSPFRERKTRVRTKPTGFLPHPKTSVAESRHLYPDGRKKLTGRFLSVYERDSPLRFGSRDTTRVTLSAVSTAVQLWYSEQRNDEPFDGAGVKY